MLELMHALLAEANLADGQAKILEEDREQLMREARALEFIKRFTRMMIELPVISVVATTYPLPKLLYFVYILAVNAPALYILLDHLPEGEEWEAAEAKRAAR